MLCEHACDCCPSGAHSSPTYVLWQDELSRDEDGRALLRSFKQSAAEQVSMAGQPIGPFADPPRLSVCESSIWTQWQWQWLWQWRRCLK